MSKKTEQKQEKPNRRFRIQFEIGYNGSEGEYNSGDSDTVPDMSLSVGQLLENHTRGKSGNVEVKKPLYFETEIPTIRDITDVKKFESMLKDRLEEVQKFIDDEKDEKKEVEQQDKKEAGKQLDLTEEIEKEDKS